MIFEAFFQGSLVRGHFVARLPAHAERHEQLADPVAMEVVAFGHVVSLDFYRFQPDRVAELLGEAGLAMFARLLREPDETKRVQRAYVLARKPMTISGED